MPQLGNFESTDSSDVEIQAAVMSRQMDASFSWDDFSWLRKLWPRKLLVKGILRPDDAERCIAAGADGNMWARIAVSGASQASCVIPGYTPTSMVARVAAGRVTEVSEDSANFAGHVIGPDRNNWWMTSSGRLRRTTPDGHVKDFPAGTNLGFRDAFRFVFGPDGNIWYADGGNVLSMTLSGLVTTYHAPGPNSGATWITLGPNGKVWFVEGASGAATIGAISPGSH